MYHAFFVLYPHVLRLFGFSCINISNPGGAMGVALKWYSPSMASHAKRCGFCLHLRTILTDKFTWSVKRHQYAIGKVGGRDAIVNFITDFHVWIPRSSGLVMCMSVGVYWKFACSLRVKFSTSLDVSLSSLWSSGLNPCTSQYSYTSLYALRSSSFFLLLISIPFK